MKKQHSIFLLPGIIMVGVALRTPFTTLPTVLTDIANGLHVSVNSLGLLTSLPLIMFALCSSFSARLASKIGLERLFTLVLALLTIGSLIRIFNLPLLYIGTILIGASIAVLNVLLPSVIQANQPDWAFNDNVCNLYGVIDCYCFFYCSADNKSNFMARSCSFFDNGLSFSIFDLATKYIL